MDKHAVTSVFTNIGTLTARPYAFLVLLVYAILWAVLDWKSLDWHGVATLATWAMTLFIQRAEHRDTQAIHAKLDELIRASGEVDDDVAKIDEEEPEDIEKQRDQEQQSADELKE